MYNVCRKGLRLAVVLSGGGFALVALGGGNPAAAPEQSKQPSHALEFDYINMCDRANGWAQNVGQVFIANDWVFKQKGIWRTSDGGQSWKEVLSAIPGGMGNISAFYRNAKAAWVVVTDESTKVIVFRTVNGGRSWDRSELNQPSIIQDSWLSFTGAAEGWLMLIPAHGMNSSPGVLYRTQDGGRHWRKVNGTDAGPIDEPELDPASQPEFARPQPYLVCGGAIAFRDRSTGWIRGSMTTTTRPFLFMTRDGGRNWQLQRLPLPPGLPPGWLDPAGLPQFFRSRDEGLLAVTYHPTDSEADHYGTVIFRTHDGGQTWKPTRPMKFAGVCSFISATKGWMWSPEPHGTGSKSPVKGSLYRTEDGGLTWASCGKALESFLMHGEDIVQLDFVDGEYGWAIARDAHNLTQLVHTTDGGQSWSAIPEMRR